MRGKGRRGVVEGWLMVAKKDWPRPMSREERRRFSERRGIKPREKRKAECDQCRKVYHPKTKTQRFCSRGCFQRFTVEGNARPRTAAAEITDGRVTKATICCEWCQEVFHPTRSVQRFCRSSCRIAASKVQRKEEARKAKEAALEAELAGAPPLKKWMTRGDPAVIIWMLGELPDGEVLCAYEIGTRLGYRFGLRTVDARRWLEKLEDAGVVKSWRDSSRLIWLRSWQMAGKGTGGDGDG